MDILKRPPESTPAGKNTAMKVPGFLLLPAGWGLVLAALILLKASAPRAAFCLAGCAVELLGLALLIRSFMPRREERT